MAGARNIAIMSLFVATLVGGPVVADRPPQFADGWHTWQVDDASTSSEMCCFSWEKGESTQKGCNLDGRNLSFNNRGDCAAAPGRVQIYVLIKHGKPEDIRTLSSNCPVSTNSEIADHGLKSAQENLSWFRDIIENRQLNQDTREDAMFALVMSGSDAAYDYFDQLLSRR